MTIEHQAKDLETLTLDDLARIAHSEHELFVGAVESALRHGIRVGEALLAARERFPKENGEWIAWMEETLDFASGTAYQYMRFAHHADQLPDDPNLSVHRARAALKGLPGLPRLDRKTEHGDAERQMARELRAKGLTWDQVGEAMGIGRRLAHRLADPKFDERVRRQQAQAHRRYRRRREREQQRAKDEERRKAARKAGGAVADLFSGLQKALDVVDDAIGEATNPDQKQALREVRNHLDLADGKINEALGVE